MKKTAYEVESSHAILTAVLKITIKTAVFFCKNENTEGVLKSPFFKDTVVSRRYCHVLFYVPCGAYLCLGRNTVKHSN